MRGHRARPGTNISGLRSAALVCFLSVGAAMAVSGCGADAAGSKPQALGITPASQSPDPAESAAPTSSEADILTSSLTDALNSLAAGSPNPDAGALRTAFESAGAEAGTVEVSIDTTPTGLEVDAMTAAVPLGDICVFGHIRDGAATVTQLPVLASGQCFVGDQR